MRIVINFSLIIAILGVATSEVSGRCHRKRACRPACYTSCQVQCLPREPAPVTELPEADGYPDPLPVPEVPDLPDNLQLEEPALGVSGASDEGHPMRVWTDNSGRYRASARLVSVTDDNVTLVKQQGAKVIVPMVRLSQADQAYIRQLSAPHRLAVALSAK